MRIVMLESGENGSAYYMLASSPNFKSEHKHTPLLYHALYMYLEDEIRTFLSNRPRLLKIFINHTFNQRGRFLTHPKTNKKIWVPWSEVSVNYLYMYWNLDPAIQTCSIPDLYENLHFSNAHMFIKKLVCHLFKSAF